jgi:photosystem II stability/assembly factor-like uncharacterized protein
MTKVCLAILLAGCGSLEAYTFHGCAIQPGNRNVWVAASDSAAVWHSTDFGAHWQSDSIFTDHQFYDIFFLDSLNGWTCGWIGEVWHTIDGGRSWQFQAYGFSKLSFRIRFVDTTHGWSSGHAGLCGRWDEASQGWDQFYAGVYDSVDLEGLSFQDTLNGWMCGGHIPERLDSFCGQGCVIRTTNGGDNWHDWQQLIRDTVNDYLDIQFFDPDTGILVGGNFRTMQGYVARTTDGGQTWSGQIPSGSLLNGLWFTDYRHGWAVGGAGTILHSTDGGLNWQLQYSGVDTTLYDVKFLDTLMGVASGVGVVLLTSDGGNTWAQSVVGVEEKTKSIDLAGTTALITVSPSVARGLVVLDCRSPSGAAPITIYDVRGRLVRELIGTKRTIWDGCDRQGVSVPSGLYFARLKSEPGFAGVKIVYFTGR